MNQAVDKEKRPPHASKAYWAGVIALLTVLIGLAAAYQLWWNKSDLPVIKQADDFTLENLDGEPFVFSQLNGKVRLVSFIFTNCPDVCPATTIYMAQLQEQLKAKGWYGTEVAFVTVTFDPERDTPEVLREYANKFRADLSGWHFLRGTEADTKKVANQFGIAVEKQPNGQFLHTMKTFLVDKDQQIRKIYGMGADMNLEEIARDIEELAAE